MIDCARWLCPRGVDIPLFSLSVCHLGQCVSVRRHVIQGHPLQPSAQRCRGPQSPQLTRVFHRTLIATANTPTDTPSTFPPTPSTRTDILLDTISVRASDSTNRGDLNSDRRTRNHLRVGRATHDSTRQTHSAVKRPSRKHESRVVSTMLGFESGRGRYSSC